MNTISLTVLRKNLRIILYWVQRDMVIGAGNPR